MEMASYFSPKECGDKTKRIVLQEPNRQVVEEFITILAMREQFEKHEVPVPNKVVMFGPPGTGKTLTAFYIAYRMQLPLILVRLDAVIHSHLGETGSNVRKIFEYAKAHPCVLFLDEFDAIARTRDNNDEVKEMSRVVNTLLQCLDEFASESIFIAATNLDKQLDHAIWRRFDTKMAYNMPNEENRMAYVRGLIGDFAHHALDSIRISQRLEGCSFADMEQIVLKAKRKAIIANHPLAYEHIEDAYFEYNPCLRTNV